MINKMMQMQCIVSEVIQEIVSNAFQIAIKTKIQNYTSNNLHLTENHVDAPVQIHVVEQEFRNTSHNKKSESFISDDNISKNLVSIKYNIRDEDKPKYVLQNEGIENIFQRSSTTNEIGSISSEIKEKNTLKDLKAHDAKDKNIVDVSSLLHVGLLCNNPHSDGTSGYINTTDKSASTNHNSSDETGFKSVEIGEDKQSMETGDSLKCAIQHEINQGKCEIGVNYETKCEESKVGVQNEAKCSKGVDVCKQKSEGAECKDVVEKEREGTKDQEFKSNNTEHRGKVVQINRSNEITDKKTKSTKHHKVVMEDGKNYGKIDALVIKRRSTRKVQNVKNDSPMLQKSTKTIDTLEKKLPKVKGKLSPNKALSTKEKQADPSASCISTTPSRSGRLRKQTKLLDM